MMRRAVVIIRHLAAGLTLLVALRFAYVQCAPWLEGIGEFAPDADFAPAQRGPGEIVSEARQERQRLLDEVAAQGSAALVPEPPAPQMLKRSIMIDLGPPRSEVFIAGKRVGQTPYGGHLTCLEGAAIDVLVLPERGAPIKKTYECTSEILPSAQPSAWGVSNLKPVAQP